MKHTTVMPYVYLCVAQCMIGINIVCAKVLLAESPMFFIISARFTLATLLLWLLHVASRPGRIPLRQQLNQLSTRDWLFLSAQGLCAGILFNSLFLFGLHYTDANIAGIITGALPAIIILMSLFFLRERLTYTSLYCMLLTLIGLLFINLHPNTQFHHLLGNSLILLALLPEAGYYVLVKMHRTKIPVLLEATILHAINLPVSWLLLYAYTDLSTLHVSFKFGIITTLMSASSAVFYVLWSMGQHSVSGTTSGLLTAIMPVSTVVIAWTALHETISSTQCMGMLFVLAAIAWHALPTREPQK